MMNPGWREDKWYPEKKQLYEKIQQPTMETWLGKTQIMTMLTQTREKKTIHPKHCQEMMRPKHKLSEQREKRHEALQDMQTQKVETTQELMRELTQEPTQEPTQETTKRKATTRKIKMPNM